MARLVKTNMARTQKINEPPRVFRKLIGVSQAAGPALVSAYVGGFIDSTTDEPIGEGEES